jgi:uncharacterized protein with PIN domain
MSKRLFLADKTVGRLARWLRLLGFDCAMQPDNDILRLLVRCRAEGRVLLTKNTALAAAAAPDECLLIAFDRIRQQLKQVMKYYNLTIDKENILTICSVCNERLDDVAPAEVRGIAPPFVFATQTVFRRCPRCRRIYWAGTHKTRMLAWLDETLDNPTTSGPN